MHPPKIRCVYVTTTTTAENASVCVCVRVCVGQGVVVECIKPGRMWGLVVTSVVLSVVLYYWVRFKVLQSVHYHVVRSINLQLFVDKMKALFGDW